MSTELSAPSLSAEYLRSQRAAASSERATFASKSSPRSASRDNNSATSDSDSTTRRRDSSATTTWAVVGPASRPAARAASARLAGVVGVGSIIDRFSLDPLTIVPCRVASRAVLARATLVRELCREGGRLGGVIGVRRHDKAPTFCWRYTAQPRPSSVDILEELGAARVVFRPPPHALCPR